MQRTAQQIVKDLKRSLTERELTISVAESCTGGLIAHLLTGIPGSSKFFHTGYVTYSNRSKSMFLGVGEVDLERHGAVSEEIARKMASGIRKKSGTDFSLSTTGNLGPEALESKPVGLVFLAVSGPKGTKVLKCRFKGTRLEIKKQAALTGLTFLLKEVKRS